MSYASYDELRDGSTLRIVQDAADDQLAVWSDIAQGEIDQFCSRDFVYEPGVTKDVWVTSSLITLPKEVSNIVAATSSSDGGGSSVPLNVNSLRVMGPGNRQIRYAGFSNGAPTYPPPTRLLTITADWGSQTPPAAVARVFRILIDRIAARSHEDDALQVNAPYARQDDGDGYSYDLGNGTLRNLLRPEDRAALWPYVHHGRVVA